MHFSDQKIKHLEMLQRAIDRMATESGRIKQVALASVAAIVSVAGSTHVWWLPLAGVMLTFAFWHLDARYLSQERWFRDIFEYERKQNGEVSFVMTPSAEIRKEHPASKAMTGWSTLTLYGMLMLIGLATSVAVYVSGTNPSSEHPQTSPAKSQH